MFFVLISDTVYPTEGRVEDYDIIIYKPNSNEVVTLREA